MRNFNNMKRKTILLSLALLAGSSAWAQSQRDIFAEEALQQRLDIVYRYNANDHFREAYDLAKSLHKDLDEALRARGIEPAQIEDDADFTFYLNVLISEANCAYKYNFWQELLEVTSNIVETITVRTSSDAHSKEDYCYQLGATAKLIGDYYFVRNSGEQDLYNYARTNYEAALEWFDEGGYVEECAKVNLDLAQLEYCYKHYEVAMRFLDRALSNGGTRLSSGSNAKGAFAASSQLQLDYQLQSAQAMCMAHTFDFDGALNLLKDLEKQFPKGDEHRAEVQRKRAKVLLLKSYDQNTSVGEASKLYANYFNDIKATVERDFMQMTADQREAYWMMQGPYVTDCYGLENNNPSLLYDVALYHKGMLLQTARSFDNLLYDGTAGHPNEKEQLAACRQRDLDNAAKGETTHEAAEYELELLRKMAADGRRKNFYNHLRYNWKDVQRALPADGCAIEFVTYERRSSVILGAIVLKKKGAPQFVRVCNESDLLACHPLDGSMTVEEILSRGRQENALIYDDPRLPRVVWNDALTAAIGNSSKVYFSPDGVFHVMGIEYLLPKSLEDKSFYRLSSTRVLVDGHNPNEDLKSDDPALVIGGIAYDVPASTRVETSSGNDIMAFSILRQGEAQITYLSGAGEECREILTCRNNPQDLFMHDQGATEHEFYAHCSQYPIIHFSTHGSSIAPPYAYGEFTASATKDILSFSSLALAACNSNLHDPDFDATNKDGILSAREIATLDLSDTKFITTSACQTGLGVITSDGVYGLQRGFKSAGASGMLMSLWSIGDIPAKIFFSEFYRRLHDGESICHSFRGAREYLAKQKESFLVEREYFDPYSLSVEKVREIQTLTFDSPKDLDPYILIDVWE